MIRSILAAALCLVACHTTPVPEPAPKAAKEHMLSLGTEREDVGLDVAIRVNDIPLFLARSRNETFFGEMTTTLKSYQVLHPYFLRGGPNVLTLTYTVSDGREGDFGPYAAKYLIADVGYEELDLVVPYTTFETRELAKPAVELPPESISGTFVVPQRLPEWRWLHGTKLTNDTATRDSLYDAYTRFWHDLDAADGKSQSYAPYAQVRYSIREFAQASEMRDGDYTAWDDFFKLASTRQTAYQKPVFLERLPEREATALRVFGNGTLAYLAVEPGSFFEHPIYIAIEGGAHDAPSGTMGPVSEIIQPWFRRDDNGAWVVDGMTR